MAYYRQPAFYKDFHCIGEKCPITCCSGWRILWLKDEVNKLKAPPHKSHRLENVNE